MSVADYVKSPLNNFAPGPLLVSASPVPYIGLSPVKGLEVTETGREVRVETEKLHLVSLGSGRLSTAVTVHPVPEGRTYIGRESEEWRPDIVVDGAGVEPRHCFIENVDSVVTIHPGASMTAVDGMRILEPTRLAQDFQSSLQRLESSDFVEKVSKFEYLAHSRPATVTSQDTPKWLVREGLRIPTTPPANQVLGSRYGEEDDMNRPNDTDGIFQYGSRTLPMRNCSVILPSRSKPPFTLIPPVSPGLKRTQEAGAICRASPVHFWSGRCTPTLSHLGEGHEEHLKACEEQHRKALEERLKEEEQVRQEQHRLEEILSMCAEYENQEKQNVDRNHKRTQPSSSPPVSSTFEPPSHPLSILSSTPSHKPNSSSVYSSSPSSYINNLPHHHSAHQQNRIKTNGSLPRDRSQALLQSTVSNDCSGSSSPPVIQGSVNSASSEDELNEILGGNSQYTSVSSKDSVEPHSNTSPHLGTVSLKYPHSPRTHQKITANQVQARIEVYESRYTRPEPRTNSSVNKFLNTSSPRIREKHAEKTETAETYQEINEELRRLCKLKLDYVRQISALKKAFTNFEAQENEILRELEMEHALITGELKDEERILIVDHKRLEDFHTQEKRMMEETEKAKHDEQEQLESAKLQLHEREARVNVFKEELVKLGNHKDEEVSQNARQELQESYKRELELMEAEKKAFEDLEFQQLETQSHRDEEKEALSSSIAEQVQILQERKVKRFELEIQQKQLQEQISSEHDMFQSKLKKVSESLSEVQIKLDSLDLMLRHLTRVDPLSTLESSPDSSPRSSTSELPAQIPRQHNQLPSAGEQINGDDSNADWRNARDAGCQSFHSIDSETSSIISSDNPGESLYNSSGDRSRPSSYHTDNFGANRELYLSSPEDNLTDSDVKKREQLLSLHDDKLLLDTPRKTSETEVTRRDRQKSQRPLTRYLPIRSQEFDLRQHVETDGHQIELCPHVTVTSNTCSGTLHKLSGKWPSWKKRWFVFDRARRALLYYSDRKETKLRGGTYFQSIQEVYVDHLQSVKSPNPQSTFCMKTRDRIYYLMAPSPEAMRIWVDVIFTGAEGYLEFLAD